MRFHIVLGFFLTCCVHYSIAQVPGNSQSGLLTLTEGISLDEWKYNEGDNPDFALKDFDDSDWQTVRISEPLSKHAIDYVNRFWLRTAINTEHLNEDSLVALLITQFGASEIYINGRLIKSLGTVASRNGYESYNPHNHPIPVMLERSDNVIAIRFATSLPSSDWVMSRSDVPLISVKLQQLENALNNWEERLKFSRFPVGFGFISGILCLLFLMLFLFFPKQLLYLFYGLFNLFLVLSVIVQAYLDAGQYELAERAYLIYGTIFLSRLIGMSILLFMLYALNRMKPVFWMYVGFIILVDFPLTILLPVEYLFISSAFRSIIIVISVWLAYHAFTSRDWLEWLVGIIACAVIIVNSSAVLQQFTTIDITWYTIRLVAPILTTVAIAIYLALRYSRINKSLEHQVIQVRQLSEENLSKEIEKQEILAAQTVELERQVYERTAELQEQKNALQNTLDELKSTQSQLIQSEKLASLGQLTAGIAHEIKNPLNFVNNFSEVSLEMIEEAREEVRRGTEDRVPKNSLRQPAEIDEAERRRGVSDEAQDSALILEILNDIEANLRKIHEHGSRADSIVKSMLQHSKGGSGKMEPTNFNALVKEYVNLSYHGMRAGKDPFSVDIDLQLDKNIGEVPLIAEDFSRVILNLCNNAFDAMREKEKSLRQPAEGSDPSADGEQGDDSSFSYKPKLTVRSKTGDVKVVIEFEDNGPGIPDDIQDKILQPFFTTKKGTQGTGLGLSITHDIIKAHGGALEIESEPGRTVFFINLQQ